MSPAYLEEAYVAGHCPLSSQGSPNNMRRRKSLPTVPVFNRQLALFVLNPLSINSCIFASKCWINIHILKNLTQIMQLSKIFKYQTSGTLRPVHAANDVAQWQPWWEKRTAKCHSCQHSSPIVKNDLEMAEIHPVSRPYVTATVSNSCSWLLKYHQDNSCKLKDQRQK